MTHSNSSKAAGLAPSLAFELNVAKKVASDLENKKIFINTPVVKNNKGRVSLT